MNAERILLNLHPPTQARLRVHKLPHGVSLTKWINIAICQRLDRDAPATIGVMPDLALAAKRPKREKGPYVLKYRQRWQYRAARREHNRLMRLTGESPGMETLIENLCKKNGEEMIQAEKDIYMEGVDVPAEPMEAARQAHADFWGVEP